MTASAPTVVRPEAVDQAIALGRARGLAAGLADALDGLDPLAVSPSCFAALPEACIRSTAAGRRAPLAHRLAELEGIRFVRLHDECTVAHAGLPHARAVALAGVRLGVLYALLDQAVEFLTTRTSAGTPLIRLQLVTGAIADTLAEAALLREGLSLAHEGQHPSLGMWHEQISALGWAVTGLFGARGYLEDHPVRALYVSELVAGTWSEVGPPW